MGDAIDPLVVVCDVSDHEDGVLALTAHALGHRHQLAQVLILEGLDVVVDILLTCCFMRLQQCPCPWRFGTGSSTSGTSARR